MARGFLSGVIWGAVFSVGAAAVASLVAGTAPRPELGDAPASTTAPAATAEPETGSAADADVASGATEPSPAPSTESGSVDPAVTEPSPRPEAGGASDLSPPPEPQATDTPSSEEGTAPQPLPTAPAAPAEPRVAEEPSISTDPAQPQPPEAPSGEVFEEEAAVPGEAAPVDDADTADTETAPDEEASNESASDTGVRLPQQDPAPVPEEAATPQQPAFPEVTENEETTPPSPTIGTPAGSLVDREDPPAPADGAGALDRFAAKTPDTDGKPLMAIILIDDGTAPASGPAGLAALQSFPYPLSFAVDATLPDASDRAAAYRSQGLEVLAMTDMPAGATASDVEVALAAALSAVPEAIGVLEGTGSGLQASREVSDQTTAILAASGHGMVLQAKGLNTAQKLAVREGVPAAPIFRDFDSAGQNPSVIRRFLDQAAFRAGQENGVVMLGRVRADTISALLLWGLQDRATRVALVPVSAVLKAQVPDG